MGTSGVNVSLRQIAVTEKNIIEFMNRELVPLLSKFLAAQNRLIASVQQLVGTGPVLKGMFDWSPGFIGSGGSSAQVFTLAGCNPGDCVLAGHTSGIPEGCLISGYVVEAGTVGVTIYNATSETEYTIADGNVVVMVFQH